MSACILDTSVTIAWYLEESFSTSARLWQQRLLDGTCSLIVPNLHYWEFGNVLRTLVVREEIEEPLAAEIYALHLEAPLDVAEPNRQDVLETALTYKATVYDAVYIALSLSHDLPLVTAERTTRPWVTRLENRVELVR